MKITISVLTILPVSSGAVAQEANGLPNMNMSEHVFNVSATIFVSGLIMLFILSLLRRVLDYRIKNRILDKGVPEEIASSILRSDTEQASDINFKWFSILTGMGLGLTVVSFTSPLGIHSLAIMSFSVALGFLAYHQYRKRLTK